MLGLNAPQKSSLLVTLIAVLTLLLAACGGNDVEVETPTEKPEAETIVQEVTEEAVAEAEQPETTEDIETVPEDEAEATAEVEVVTIEEPSTETAAVPDGWIEFTSEEFGFSVMMPGEPEPIVQSLGADAPGSNVSLFMYEGKEPGREYAYGTAYVAMPLDVSGLSEEEVEALFDDSRNGGLQSMGATLVDEHSAPLQAYPGRLVEFNSDFMKGMNWFILAENNLYQVMVLTSSLDEEFTAEDRAFLESFTLHDDLPQPDFSAAPAGEAATTQPASEERADAGSPEAVLQAVFDAASSGEFESLAGLCDPTGENDGDTQTICSIADDTATQASFIEHFSTGQISGSAVISADGTEAEVPFLFGPDGQQEETMKMINRDGQWYLSSF
ncbi:MAG: hypothetical protein KDJ52_08380 [Anaerolineae bacterium]|nr:hypothetical protein [Anaerolineae bacterium]